MTNAKPETLKYVPTTCPYCGVGCGLNLIVKDGKAVGVAPWQRSPINEGKLCPKGMTCWEFIHSPDRLTKPLIKKNGKFEEASWDEALDLVATKFKEISDKNGPKSIGFQVSCRTPNEECYIMQKLARVGFKTNNVDNCARICHGPSVAGLSLSFGSGAATNPFEDVLNSDFILVWGSNAVEAHPLAGRRIAQAKLKGIPIMVVDPRYSPTARLADTWIRFNPSTHIALINSMMYWIIKENLHDKEFIEKRTKGFEDLKKTVENYADVEKITGVPVETVKDMARKYAAAKNGVIIYCLGITELTTGTDNVRSLGNLSMLCGNIGRPGVGVNPLRGQNNVQGACDMGAYPNVYSGYQKCELPEMRKKMEEAWGMPAGSLPEWYGSTLTEQISQCGDPIKAMYIFALNPAVSYPDSNHVKRSLDKLDFLVVQDIFFTETCEYADVVLPGASFAEKDGTFTSGERRINRVRKAVNPPGEAKEDWEIFVLLAKKLGLKGFDFKSPQQIWDDMRSVTPSMFGATNARIDIPGSVHWPCPTVEHPGTPILHKEKFASPDGLGTFFGIEYRPPAEVADAEYPFTLMTGRLIFHYHTRTQTDRAKVLHYEVPENFVQINTDDAKRLGIKEGDHIKVRSRRGETTPLARVTDEVAPGVLYMAMHFPNGANNLTNTALDPMSKMPELKHCAVAVEKIAEAK
ncbi:MAG: formate dehydrogenase subunit alpha [Methanoregulaceae archaeon]|jgi:formate dehydrogenase major subunit|nr:formate dehydrogenase subunit alpha [Methanoregulaceae archaeon]MCC7469071.1 formate dehydrogenase subunit alpha [Burkholderiaceae bacterium]NLH25875.1 formate dehydrogenase subunit alpha [Methanomicrobiales archaeon]HNI41411.1 formate dehydrogenase subunit alpha [Methanoregulaceae archaeon]HNW81107.1 formate dehydrogenase subunit alpha [Methanoregulaceae archaeon]